MRKMMNVALMGLLVGVFAAAAASAGDHPAKSAEKSGSDVKLETLLKTQLEVFEGAEVIVSRVTLPPHASLPKHWHPGEEFGYVLEGSIVLWQKGKDDVLGKKGDVVKIPLKQIHAAKTGDEGATVLVFRVHEEGKPERVSVD